MARVYVRRPEAERFWEQVDKEAPNGCYEFTGAKTSAGYGQFRAGSLTDGSRRVVMAHRFAYELMVGLIPTGLTIDHLCRNPGCVNPAHLEPVTNRENFLRGVHPNAIVNRSGVCKYGHSLADHGVVRADGRTRCRRCYEQRLTDRRLTPR